MFRSLKLRDRKESDLDSIALRIHQAELSKVAESNHFKKRLAEYQVWKKEKNIEGIKY